jgi:hypothetical protein
MVSAGIGSADRVAVGGEHAAFERRAILARSPHQPYAAKMAEVVNSDFLFLSDIHRLHDNKKPIGIARVVLRGSSLLFPDDAL